MFNFTRKNYLFCYFTCLFTEPVDAVSKGRNVTIGSWAPPHIWVWDVQGRELANPKHRRADSGSKWHHHRAAAAPLWAGLAQFWYRKWRDHAHLCSGQWTESIQCYWLMWDMKWPQRKKNNNNIVNLMFNTDMLILKVSVQWERRALDNIHICEREKKRSRKKDICTKVETQL